MPWRLVRYISREIIPYFLLSLLVATVIIFAQEAGRFSELFIKRNVPPELVRTLWLTILTRVMVITLPTSLLLGILLGLARLSSDNEILSLMANGISRAQLLIPLLSLALPVWLLMSWLTLVETPRSAARFHQIRSQLILQGIRTQVSPRVFDHRFVDRVLYIHNIDRTTDLWEGIFLVSVESGRPILLTGTQGLLELGDNPESSKLHLFDGTIHRLEPDRGGDYVYHLEGFSSYHVRFDPQSREAARFQLENQRKPEPLMEMSLNNLLNISKQDYKTYIKARVEAGRRLALPFACLLFPPLGLVLASLGRLASRSAGFTLGISLACAYYLLLLAAEHLARGQLLPPLLALWLPNVIFLAAVLLGWKYRSACRQSQNQLTAPEWKRRLFYGWGEKRSLLWSRLRTFLNTGRPKQWLPWLRLIDQDLVIDFGRYTLLFLAGFWLLFMVFTLFELSSDVIQHQISASKVVSYIIFLTPEVIYNLAPPCTLLAAVLVASLRTRTNQVAALKSAGMSVYRIAAPILLTCLVLAIMLNLWGNAVVPEANILQEQLRFYIKKGRFPLPLELSPLAQEGNWVYGKQHRIFHFDQFDRERLVFSKLWVLDLNPADLTLSQRIEARRARWDQVQHQWQLEDARVWKFQKDRLVQSWSCDTLYLALEESPDYFQKDVRKPQYMSASELATYIRELRQKGVDVRSWSVAFHRKLASPIACFVMGLVGIPFGLTLGRKGTLRGVGLGIFIGLTYWLSLGFFEGLGKYGYVSPVLAGWGPAVLFGALGVFALFWVRT